MKRCTVARNPPGSCKDPPQTCPRMDAVAAVTVRSSACRQPAEGQSQSQFYCLRQTSARANPNKILTITWLAKSQLVSKSRTRYFVMAPGGWGSPKVNGETPLGSTLQAVGWLRRSLGQARAVAVGNADHGSAKLMTRMAVTRKGFAPYRQSRTRECRCHRPKDAKLIS